MQAVYDEPKFIVRNIWRLEGGWYDGTPSNLKPAPEAEQAKEIAGLAGGVERIVARALERLASGELALASHLSDWAVAAAPENKEAQAARAKVYEAQVAEAKSTMSRGSFGGPRRSRRKRLEVTNRLD